MRSGEFFLYTAVGLAISLFILSMVFNHDLASLIKSRVSIPSRPSAAEAYLLFLQSQEKEKEALSSLPISSSSSSSQLRSIHMAPQVPLVVKPAVIQSVLPQRTFPNRQGIASSSDFAALMNAAATQPNVVPLQRKKPTAEEKEAEKLQRKKAREQQQQQGRDTTKRIVVDNHKAKRGESNSLSCQHSYEPTCKIYPYIRFWNQRFYPEDCYESPLRPPEKLQAPLDKQKYLVFEPDRGGWNNIRMAAETAIIFAHATGRTLVLPPAARWYLLDKSTDESDNVSSFSKFFDLRRLKESMTMITTEDFLEKVAKIPGFMKKSLDSDEDITQYLRHLQKLWDFYAVACYTEQWEPGKQFIGFNLSHSNPGIIGTFNTDVHHNKRYKTMVAHGRVLRPYDEQLHSERVIYFPGDYRNTHRILTHFYSYLYWEDTHTERIYRRIVRDRLHYHDSIFCAASLLVHAIHSDASTLTNKPIQSLKKANKLTMGGNTNEDATYFAMHIRRGDFQYHETQLSAQAIVDNTFHLFDPNITTLLYIATDEKNKSFFEPFMKGPFKVKFLKNYFNEQQMKQVVGDFSMNHIGMIEQVICANAHTFVGTPFSTFTGYITRMRGYYRDGRYERTFYTIEAMEKSLQKQRPLVGPFWAREFETAHKEIDDFIG